MFIDISYPYSDTTAIYPGNPAFKTEKVLNITKGDSANVTEITIGSHCGTHMDAPSHIIEGGKTLDQVPLERMNGRAIIIEVLNKSDITESDLCVYHLKKEDIVIFKTDNSYNYKGINVLKDYTTLDYKAASYLAECGVKMVGIDYMTIERPRHKRVMGKSVHRILLEHNILIAEALKLNDVKEGIYRLNCFPINILGIDGIPARIVLEKDKEIEI